MALTPSQKATAGFFLVMAALFLVQTLVGVASQHYRAEIGGFFGIDSDRYLPYNIVRTWHVQLSIFWVVTSFLAAGIFLTPMIARHKEPRGQHVLANLLLGALTIVVVGSLLGELAGIHGWFGEMWSWFGMQGFEYLDLGRFWQILLTLGLAFWVVILWRGLRSRLDVEHRTNMPWLFFYAAFALPAFYAVGLLAHPRATFAVADFWRFIVVHLWVEDFLELFTTVMVAYMFVLLGVRSHPPHVPHPRSMDIPPARSPPGVELGDAVLPLLWIGFNGVRHRGSHQDVLDDDDLLLFTEVFAATSADRDDEPVGAN